MFSSLVFNSAITCCLPFLQSSSIISTATTIDRCCHHESIKTMFPNHSYHKIKIDPTATTTTITTTTTTT